MNKGLAAARKKFGKQKAPLKGGAGDFDNSPFQLGKHTFIVEDSELRPGQRGGVQFENTHYTRLKCCSPGTDNNKSCFPFATDLDTVKGITDTATNIQRILGDVLPGEKDGTGEFQLNIAEFMEVVEDLVIKCIGQLVEVKVQNQKPKPDGSHLKDDGDPWQVFYIQRGLGDDGKGVTQRTGPGTRSDIDPDDDLTFGTPPRGTKKVAKKKVAKKKVVKKKR